MAERFGRLVGMALALGLSAACEAPRSAGERGGGPLGIRGAVSDGVRAIELPADAPLLVTSPERSRWTGLLQQVPSSSSAGRRRLQRAGSLIEAGFEAGWLERLEEAITTLRRAHVILASADPASLTSDLQVAVTRLQEAIRQALAWYEPWSRLRQLGQAVVDAQQQGDRKQGRTLLLAMQAELNGVDVRQLDYIDQARHNAIQARVNALLTVFAPDRPKGLGRLAGMADR